MIEEFIKKYDTLVSSKKYEELMNYCTQELQKLFSEKHEFSHDESCYAATIYSNMVPFLDNEDGLKCLDAAISFVPNSAELYYQRAELKCNLSDFQGAIEDYKKILEYEPDNENAQDAINSLVIDFAQTNNIPCLSCTLKTGQKVYRIVTEFGTFDIPNED